MSVSRNYLSKAPYYSWRAYDIAQAGITTGASGRLKDAASNNTTMALVIGTDTNSTSAVVWKTTDGTSYTRIAAPFGTTAAGANSIAYGAGNFVMVGDNNLIATSPESSGTSWTVRTSANSGSGNIELVRYVNGYFIAATTNSPMQYSSDGGVTWIASTNTTSIPTSINRKTAELQNFLYYNGTYIYTTGITSSTGTTATRRMIQSKNINFNAVTVISADAQNVVYLQDLGDGKTPIVTSHLSTTALPGPGVYMYVDQSNASSWLSVPNNGTNAATVFPASRGPLATYAGSATTLGNGGDVTWASGITSYQNRVRYYYNDGFYQALWRDSTGPNANRIATIAWHEDREEVVDNNIVPGSFAGTNEWWDSIGFTLKNKKYIIDASQTSNNYGRQLLIGSFTTRPLLTTTTYR